MAEIDSLVALARSMGFELDAEYLDLLRESDGADRMVGDTALVVWPVDQVLEAHDRYEGVLLFAGDGANTVYGFDARAGGEIVEGDWIGLGRDELIRHGRSFGGFLERLARGEWPVASLLAYLDDRSTDEHVTELERVVAELAGSRTWCTAPPEFVDQVEEAGDRTVGILHEIEAGRDEQGRLLDEQRDRAQLEEVEAIVAALREFGAATDLDIAFELEQDPVGWIEHGEPDDALRIGLLEAWRKPLGIPAALARFRELPEVFRFDGSPFRHGCRLAGPAEPAEIAEVWTVHARRAELERLWAETREAELYLDLDYGQWGLRLLSPQRLLERTRMSREGYHASEYREHDLCFAEFVGDSELLVLTADGTVLVALPLDGREDWPVAGDSIPDFLHRYRDADSALFWDTSGQDAPR